MQNLQFRPIAPYDVSNIQAMTQNAGFRDLIFNQFSQPIFVATCQQSIVGFTYGKKGHGENSDVMTICRTYFRNTFGDEHYAHELHLAFINWAERSLGVQRYQLGEYDKVKPIHFSFPTSPPTQPIETYLEPQLPQPTYT